MTQKNPETGCGTAPRPDPIDKSVGLRTLVPRPAQTGTARTLNSADLLGEQGTVFIQHKGEMYRLQSTRQGKLILTK
jgi:hemin uptake protein HemP